MAVSFHIRAVSGDAEFKPSPKARELASNNRLRASLDVHQNGVVAAHFMDISSGRWCGVALFASVDDFIAAGEVED